MICIIADTYSDFIRLYEYSVEEWYVGETHKIRESVSHYNNLKVAKDSEEYKYD